MSESQVLPVDGWLGTRQAIGVALAAAVGHAVILELLTRDAAIRLVALELTLCYAIYIGFALTRGGHGALLIESLFAGVGMTLALLGLSGQGPGWLALGWAVHGGWDMLHHRDHHVVGVRGVPIWYVPLCAFVDLLVALTILVVLGVS